ncbi:hypothetical protein [Thiomicrospira microaerophila]|uniref:hypothetical protein n=1 Tax=Thiomicrospira microaerophila TaxID=406020 RepID=UPI0005C8B549|nr:hypothetical protein [Thiomicrospira microaerophila]
MLLSNKTLQNIMSEDVYFAIPCSVSKYLFNSVRDATSLFLMERIVSLTLQKGVKESSGISIRLSYSLLEKHTKIKSRTLATKLNALEEDGLIKRSDVNNHGQLIHVLLPESITKFIHKRFKKEPTLQANSEMKSSIDVATTPDNHTSLNLSNFNVEQLNIELKNIKEEISEIESLMKHELQKELKKRNLRIYEIDEYFLKNLKNSKMEHYQSSLATLKYRLDNINHDLTTVKCQVMNKVQANPDKKILDTSKSSSDHKNVLRFISKKLSKGLLTRLKKLKKIGDKLSIHKQILWSLRFGWYRNKDWTPFHCLNHALKLVRLNEWTIPAGYDENQINGLVNFHLLG